MPRDSYFQGNPTRLDISRSSLGAKPRWFGSWNVGRLVPIFATSIVQPGDTFKMSIASAIRMVRPAFPVMDDMEITVEAYFVPHRLILSRKSMSPDLTDSSHSWSAFIGAQDSILNMPTPGDVTLPKVQVTALNYVTGSVGDCLGYHKPQTAGGAYDVNCLKILAYYSIWNEYFREPNCQVPVTYSIDSYNRVNLVGSDAGIDPTAAGAPYLPCTFPCAPVSRYHGFFGSALPWPQRNSNQVTMPLGDFAPVNTGDDHPVPFGQGAKAMHLYETASGSPVDYPHNLVSVLNNTGSSIMAVNRDSTQSVTSYQGSGISNLWADLSEATVASVNEFRLAVQTQRWYEALARSGNKYSDLVHGMFGVRGVSIPDRPEYLGGFTAPINMSQVNDTAANLGDTGAFSLSNPSGYLFTKSFTEHGTIMVVACCRVRESFAQGINPEDIKFDRFDYYWPQFANLGEQPLLKKLMYVTGVSGSTDDQVFGYQEAWAEYRMFTDQVTGYMNPSAQSSIGGYTYSNFFNGAPTLKGYLDASKQVDNVDRTLTVNHTTAGFQLFGSFLFDIQMVRPMPTYSIPGLVDHH